MAQAKAKAELESVEESLQKAKGNESAITKLLGARSSDLPGLSKFAAGLSKFAAGLDDGSPVTVAPKLQQQAGLPEGTAVAYYAGAALQSHAERRTHEDKQGDGDLLVQGLASRLGGTVTSAEPLPDPEVTFSVWGDQAVPPEQLIELLRPYDEGDFKVEDQTKNSYSVYGTGTYLLVNYWSPQLYTEKDAPPALGQLRSRPLHHWDLSVGRSRKKVAADVASRARGAALALAGRCGGIPVDEYRFPLTP